MTIIQKRKEGNNKKSLKNIYYKTDGIANYFNGYRDKWEDFYPSEHWAFETLAGSARNLGKVLDVGCAMGGLGLSLSERFKLDEYFGVDINPQAIEGAKSRTPLFSFPAQFNCGDIEEMPWIGEKKFDIVISLSCADWNIDTYGIIEACWKSVKQSGSFVISVRLTADTGTNDIHRSYQPISYDSHGNIIESANYVVFNYQQFFNLIAGLKPKPSLVSAYGYWRKPSSTAITPYKNLVFAVFIITKSTTKKASSEIKTELLLPLSLFIKSE